LDHLWSKDSTKIPLGLWSQRFPISKVVFPEIIRVPSNYWLPFETWYHTQ
jgi:hypothetical protein